MEHQQHSKTVRLRQTGGNRSQRASTLRASSRAARSLDRRPMASSACRSLVTICAGSSVPVFTIGACTAGQNTNRRIH